MKQKRDRYSKSCIAAKFIDREMIPILESIYNLFNIVNNKIDVLEKRLPNIENNYNKF